jgi:predicted RNA-binding protein with PUA-like domain
MKRWLVKTEPGDYSAGDLEREGSALWDGVRNATALIHLRAFKPGDRVLIYHTGKEKALVGEAEVSAEPVPDPTDEKGKAVAPELTFRRWWPRPVKLAEIKADDAFAEFDLVRISRLSVVPVSADQWKRLEKMAKHPAE